MMTRPFLLAAGCAALLAAGCTGAPKQKPRILSSYAPPGAPQAPPLNSRAVIEVPTAPVGTPVAVPVVPVVPAAPTPALAVPACPAPQPAVPVQPVVPAPQPAAQQPAHSTPLQLYPNNVPAQQPVLPAAPAAPTTAAPQLYYQYPLPAQQPTQGSLLLPTQVRPEGSASKSYYGRQTSYYRLGRTQ